MVSDKKLEILESSAVQSHISMLQGVINRMAENSANCKNWTVTLVVQTIPRRALPFVLGLWRGF